MRKVMAIIAALIGGYILWQGVKFGRVALLMRGSEIDGSLTMLALVAVGAGLAFIALGWWLFRDPAATPSALDRPPVTPAAPAQQAPVTPPSHQTEGPPQP